MDVRPLMFEPIRVPTELLATAHDPASVANLLMLVFPVLIEVRYRTKVPSAFTA